MVDSKHQWKAWVYLLPAIILLLIFTVYPIINTVVTAFIYNVEYKPASIQVESVENAEDKYYFYFVDEDTNEKRYMSAVSAEDGSIHMGYVNEPDAAKSAFSYDASFSVWTLTVDEKQYFFAATDDSDADLIEATEENIEMLGQSIYPANLMLNGKIVTKLDPSKPEAEEEDPRAALADALLKFQQAKEAAKKMSFLYPIYSGRLEKDTDEISIDKTFVLDQEVESLCLAVRRIVTFNENRPKAERSVFTPMISSPIVPVEVKITGILNKMSKKKATSLKELLDESVSLPDMIAIFLGVLELIKIRKILIYDTEGTLLGDDAKFVINDNPEDIEKDANGNELYSSDFDRGAEQIEMNLDNESKGDGE